MGVVVAVSCFNDLSLRVDVGVSDCDLGVGEFECDAACMDADLGVGDGVGVLCCERSLRVGDFECDGVGDGDGVLVRELAGVVLHELTGVFSFDM